MPFKYIELTKKGLYSIATSSVSQSGHSSHTIKMKIFILCAIDLVY